MSSTTAEIIQTCEALPPDKQAELADFARFLLARQGDVAWELEDMVADTWNKLGPAPEIDYDKI